MGRKNIPVFKLVCLCKLSTRSFVSIPEFHTYNCEAFECRVEFVFCLAVVKYIFLSDTFLFCLLNRSSSLVKSVSCSTRSLCGLRQALKMRWQQWLRRAATPSAPACCVMKGLSNNRFAEGINLLMVTSCSGSSSDSHSLGGKGGRCSWKDIWKEDGQKVRFPGGARGCLTGSCSGQVVECSVAPHQQAGTAD